jgi:hypothetical protein
VGKIDACEIPNRIVPSHNMVADSWNSRINPRLAMQPAKSSARIVMGLARVETQIPNRRPSVKDPQKAEVK